MFAVEVGHKQIGIKDVKWLRCHFLKQTKTANRMASKQKQV